MYGRCSEPFRFASSLGLNWVTGINEPSAYIYVRYSVKLCSLLLGMSREMCDIFSRKPTGVDSFFFFTISYNTPYGLRCMMCPPLNATIFRRNLRPFRVVTPTATRCSCFVLISFYKQKCNIIKVCSARCKKHTLIAVSTDKLSDTRLSCFSASSSYESVIYYCFDTIGHSDSQNWFGNRQRERETLLSFIYYLCYYY